MRKFLNIQCLYGLSSWKENRLNNKFDVIIDGKKYILYNLLGTFFFYNKNKDVNSSLSKC